MIAGLVLLAFIYDDLTSWTTNGLIEGSVLLTSGVTAEEAIVFKDTVAENMNETPWLRSNNQMGGYKLVQNPAVDHAPYMNVGNCVMLHSYLEREITRDNSAGFRLTIKVLHKGDQRGAVVWLLDSNGNQGYGFLWIPQQPAPVPTLPF